jgi:hypothetical protein
MTAEIKTSEGAVLDWAAIKRLYSNFPAHLRGDLDS